MFCDEILIKIILQKKKMSHSFIFQLLSTHFCYTHFCYVSHFCYAVLELLTFRRNPVSYFCYDPLTFVTLFWGPEKVTKMSWDSINKE